MKKKVIIIYPLIFREFDYYRFELKYLLKKFDVEVHEIINMLNPELANIYNKKTWCRRGFIKRYKNFEKWKRDIKKKTEKFNVTVIIYDEPDSLKKFLVRYYLSSLKLKIIKFSVNKAPKRMVTTKLIINKILRNFSLKTLIYFINNSIFRFISKLIFKVDCLMVLSGVDYNHYKKNSLIGEVKKIHSYDISNALILEKKKFNRARKNNISLLIDTPGPRYDGDEKVDKIKKYHTPEKWYPSLNRFFDFLETNFKTSVKIAPHPKTKPKKFSKDFNFREVLFNKLAINVRNAKIVISKVPGSNALLYAAFYKKPVLFIYSNEMIKHKNFMDSFQSYYEALGYKPINIDKPFKKSEISNILKMRNMAKYKRYIENYGTARKDKNPNFLILTGVINKFYKSK